MNFEEFKIKDINSNRKPLEKLKPRQQIAEINDAYQRNCMIMKDAEIIMLKTKTNKINRNKKQYRVSNKTKLQHFKEEYKDQIQQRQKSVQGSQ